MTNFKKQLVSAAAAGSMLLSLVIPAAAGTEIVISGNGAGSDNTVGITQTSTTTVNQTNTANVSNNVNADANTGKNDANFNTGGDVTIDTGNAKVDVDIDNKLNKNSASVDCCAPGDTKVEISGNGAKSDNDVILLQSNVTTVDQDNTARVKNYVNADADTGKNDANLNTGGDVTIKTGKAEVDVDVSTKANVNSATVGNGNSNPSATFMITGNGAKSDNTIGATLSSATAVDQDNNAYIKNKVYADADTGKNDANFNTGGDVTIMTGDATVDVDVDNSVNFNHADVDCGCLFDVLAKISGNGVWSDNDLAALLSSAQVVDQDNYAYLKNKVYADADTGKNDAEKNTGEPEGDPSIVTGNATSNTDVSNSGNVNVVGDMPFDWPDLPDFPEVEFSFSFAALLAFFGLSV